MNIDIFEDNCDKKLYGEFRIPRTGQSIYIPLKNKKVISESFDLYSANHILRRIHKNSIKTLSRFINIKLFYKKIMYLGLNKNIKNILDGIYKDYNIAIYTGIDALNKSYTFQIMDDNANIQAYAKICRFQEGKRFIDNEKQNLEYLKQLNLESIEIPKIIYFDDINNTLIQSTKQNLKKDNGKLSIEHINFFTELYQKTKISYDFKDSSLYRHIIAIKRKFNDEDIKILMDRILDKLMNNYNIKKIQYCFSHHDFHKNNVKIFKDKLFVYDWELGEYSIIYYDLFYYIYEPMISKNSKSPQHIIDSILNNEYIDKFELDNGLNKLIRKQNLIIYVCEFIYSYIFNLNTSLDDKCILKSIDILNILLN